MSGFDVTPTVTPVYEDRREREETATLDFNRPRLAVEQTAFVELQRQVPALQRDPDGTPTGDELRAAEIWPGARPDRDAEPEMADLIKARDARLALLARKYEGSASTEDTARLQILTERLRKLAPRVTSADVDEVAGMVANAEGIASRLADVKKKFGLR